MDLVYWRDVRKTGVVFTGLVIGLASVFQLSVITVFSHICLAAIIVTFPLRLYYKLLELLRWNPGVHPYQWVCQCQLIVDFAKLKSKLNDAALKETTKTLLLCSARRSYLDYDSSLTDRETVMLVEEVVLLITFAITELKRLIFIGSIIDSIKVRVCCWDNVILPTNIKEQPCRWFNGSPFVLL